MRELAAGIWLHEFPVARNIGTRAVVRLSSGGLWIHSPPEITAELANKIRALGPVEAIVAPNNAHHQYVVDWCEAFPEAHCYVARGVPAKQPGLKTFELLEEVAAQRWADDFEVITLKGVPLFDETVFLHKESRTLILTDLIQHYPPPASLFDKFFFAPMGWKGICPPPPIRFDFVVHDRHALMASIDRVRAWEFDRIVVTHGECLEDNANEIFETICNRIRTERGSVFHGFLMRHMLNRLIDGGLPEPR